MTLNNADFCVSKSNFKKLQNPAHTDPTKSEKYSEECTARITVVNEKNLLIVCTLVKAATACSHIPTVENIPAISCKTDNLS